MIETPNIFKHATSELSQDAFIAWLLEWSNPKYKNANDPLHKLGTSFLEELLDTKNIALSNIESFKLKTQHHKIDVYLELVMNNETIGIIIEDKVYSSDHSNQLIRYKEIISKKAQKVVPIYFKTGFQHCYEDVEKKGYYAYDVKKFSSLLRNGIEQGVQNDIVSSYCSFITEREHEFDNAKDSFKNYKKQLIGDWNIWSSRGFFEDHTGMFDAQTGSVGPNRKPLVAFWFGHRDLSIVDETNQNIILRLYIDVVCSNNQIKVNYRIDVKNHPQENSFNRNKIYNAFKPYMDSAGIYHKKPTFKRAKESMLLAQVTNLDTSLMYNGLVELLMKYRNVLDNFIDNQEKMKLT